MKKLLPLFCAIGFLAQPALAANNITALQNLGQSDFNALSEDLGSALSYKPVTPAAPRPTPISTCARSRSPIPTHTSASPM